MSKVEDAMDRLERAVMRLENAMDRLGQSDENRAAALTAAKADYAALATTTERVAARLDAAIGRLDRALEG